MTGADQSKLLQGMPVTRTLDAGPSTEVAIFGAVWVNAPIARYGAAVKDIEHFEKGENFRVTKKISSPPKLEDFAQLTIPDEDFEDLKSCKVGSCEVKLGQPALTRLFGLKPTVCVNHLTIVEKPNRTMIASKMLYASHYFWTALELPVLAPDASRGEGFWFASVNRSRSDGLSGFGGK